MVKKDLGIITIFVTDYGINSSKLRKVIGGKYNR
ncbi:hypothetical protein J2S19_003915 [Metabacillus malikii]|uniref:Uncharacterized protein n=1 Tax=Metabacillus malikii TaxID=1504265 RepID=A0ABT9ZM50_9BACI|nr:hypothetical protein [Metabacillus malikii]